MCSDKKKSLFEIRVSGILGWPEIHYVAEDGRPSTSVPSHTLGMRPRASCVLSKHSPNRETSPALKQVS